MTNKFDSNCICSVIYIKEYHFISELNATQMDHILVAWLEVIEIRPETLLTKVLKNVAAANRSHL
jgi:hypothetical protein